MSIVSAVIFLLDTSQLSQNNGSLFSILQAKQRYFSVHLPGNAALYQEEK
jgi:hypothetical protein